MNILYNEINLPQNYEQNGKTLDFIYTGVGEKIKKISQESTRFYISGIEYEDVNDGNGPSLVFIQTEEGRIRPRSTTTIYPPSNNFVYDYFLKDHLNNVRAVLTEEENRTDYFATMEMQNSVAEKEVFKNIEETRDDKPASEPVDAATTPDLKVSKLESATGVKVGVAKILKVEQGDRIDLNVKYYFNSQTYSNNLYTVSDFLSQLANSFIFGSNSIAGSSAEKQLDWANSTFMNNQGVNTFLSNSLNDQSINDPSQPQGFLIYMFFDDKFEFHADASGVLQVKDPNVLGDLGMLNIKMPSNGFLYIYTNNESSKIINYNNLSISHYQGTLIEENHYYPYGLLMEGASNSASLQGWVNKYKFGSKELETELGLNQLDFEARFYDPAIGRFNFIDPLADYQPDFTSYRYAFDNPINFIDPTGLSEIQDNEGESSNSQDNLSNDEEYPGQWFIDLFNGTNYHHDRIKRDSENNSSKDNGDQDKDYDVQLNDGYEKNDDLHYDLYGEFGGNNSGEVAQDIGGSGGNSEQAANSGGGTWDPVTNQRISQLDSRLQGPATDFINAAQAQGVNLRITQGFRSIAEQDALYAQGRTAPGSIVTNARGGQSYHNYGLAFDVVMMNNGQPVWDRLPSNIGALGATYGFEWGGNWRTFQDYPHFQMTFGQSILDLQKK